MFESKFVLTIFFGALRAPYENGFHLPLKGFLIDFPSLATLAKGVLLGFCMKRGLKIFFARLRLAFETVSYLIICSASCKTWVDFHTGQYPVYAIYHGTYRSPLYVFACSSLAWTAKE